VDCLSHQNVLPSNFILMAFSRRVQHSNTFHGLPRSVPRDQHLEHSLGTICPVKLPRSIISLAYFSGRFGRGSVTRSLHALPSSHVHQARLRFQIPPSAPCSSGLDTRLPPPDIADVTNFVHPETPLDLEASERGTSVYLVERRIDMLPKPLTEGAAGLALETIVSCRVSCSFFCWVKVPKPLTDRYSERLFWTKQFPCCDTQWCVAISWPPFRSKRCFLSRACNDSDNWVLKRSSCCGMNSGFDFSFRITVTRLFHSTRVPQAARNLTTIPLITRWWS
jgi:hypothetical protein